MKIIKLEAESFKRLRAVSITPDGAVVRIQGQNGAGKTSVLDAIAAAIGGEKLCPAQPIRSGADKARATVELDNGLVVERRWTASGSTLTVKTREGAALRSPQKVLDALVGRLSFDPLAFMRLAPREQAETLRRMAGVDVAPLDLRRKAAYDARTAANRQVEQLRARLVATPPLEAPDAPVSTAELLAEQQRRSDVHAANERRRLELGRVRDLFVRAAADVASHVARIADLEAALTKARADHAAAVRQQEELRTKGEALKAEVAALKDPDLAEVLGQLKSVEATNDRVRAKKARAQLSVELSAADAEARRLDEEIGSIDAAKVAALAAAKLPIAGLGFTDAGVTMNALPLEQASGAEQLRVSLAMGLALNPELKVMLIRDGSLLDAKSLAMVGEMATAAGAQVWIEMVSGGGESGILIEDGEVAGAAKATAPAASPAAPTVPAAPTPAVSIHTIQAPF
jgi:energy-coupling factor transporter ATP-binding protein EcfA2